MVWISNKFYFISVKVDPAGNNYSLPVEIIIDGNNHEIFKINNIILKQEVIMKQTLDLKMILYYQKPSLRKVLFLMIR